jgi:hypothetical protein
MDYIRIKEVSESDFHTIVKKAGGVRLKGTGEADYLLNEALIELKFIVEEGFDKIKRQEKLAALFKQRQSNRPVIVIDPESLDEAESKKYYNIVARPIRKAVKKAAGQLEITSQRYNPRPTKVLTILNLGYTALFPDEFRSVCFNCVLDYADNIDWVICGGLYFHSDGFDNYLFERFDAIPINVNRLFPSYETLLNSWHLFVEDLATSLCREIAPPDQSRLPVLDLDFEIDGIRYVKPAPTVPSNCFPPGQSPRDNSSGLEKCPPVARTLPHLSEIDWKCFKEKIPSSQYLQSSYKEWLKYERDEDKKHSIKLKPIVTMDVRYADFAAWIKNTSEEWRYPDLCYFSKFLFEKRIREILDGMKEKTNISVVPLEYIYFVIHEIGRDKVNDLCSIYYICEIPGFERKENILKNEKLFFEYGATVAASYAVKRKIDALFYNKKRYTI